MSDEGFYYVCVEPQDEVCAENCTSLAACEECGCAVVSTEIGGPWGEVMDVIFCLLPIIFLIVVTVKRNPWPTTASLPFSAVLMLLIRLMYLGSDPILTCGSVILGLHEALTPLTIMAGAITLFETMEATYCLPYMMREMKALTAGHPIAELQLIFAFAYMVEGASGFGTPVALGAPMLVSTGHDKLESVVVLLIMNTFATVWGAVGTPIWFGFGNLDGIGDDEFQKISYKAAVALAFSAMILMPFVLTVVVPFQMVKENIRFVFAALLVTVGPALGISFVSFEFPSLMGGLVGCVLTALLIKFKVGLRDVDHHEDTLGRSVQDIGSVSENSLVRKYHKSVSAVSDVTAGSNSGRMNGGTSSLQRQLTSSSWNPAEQTVDQDQENEKTKGTGTLSRSESASSFVSAVSDVQESEKDPASSAKLSDKAVSFKDEENGNGVETSQMAFEDVGIVGNSEPAQEEAATSIRSLKETVDDHLGPRKSYKEGYIQDLVLRTSPIWAVVLILIITRVEQIGVKQYLTKREPYGNIFFGTYGEFRISVSLVLQLLNILTYPGLSWKYELLYIPFLIPFVLVSLITMFIYRKDMDGSPRDIAKTVASRLKNPAIALLGALVLVQLMIQEAEAAPAFILGSILAKWLKQGFIVISAILGALGSFFSGSTTVSNLTFGEIQLIAAESIGTSTTAMLALQSVGASAGNGICLNNIIAACTVVGLNVGEGKILARTFKFVISSTTIGTIVMLIFFFRF